MAKCRCFFRVPLTRRGLSLIELLTTIVIMGVLTTAAIPLGEEVL